MACRHRAVIAACFAAVFALPCFLLFACSYASEVNYNLQIVNDYSCCNAWARVCDCQAAGAGIAWLWLPHVLRPGEELKVLLRPSRFKQHCKHAGRTGFNPCSAVFGPETPHHCCWSA